MAPEIEVRRALEIGASARIDDSSAAASAPSISIQSTVICWLTAPAHSM